MSELLKSNAVHLDLKVQNTKCKLINVPTSNQIVDLIAFIFVFHFFLLCYYTEPMDILLFKLEET